MLLPSGNPFNHEQYLLPLQPIIPPTKSFVVFPLCGMLRRSRCVQIYCIVNNKELDYDD